MKITNLEASKAQVKTLQNHDVIRLIKKLAQDGTFTTETVVAIMGEEKKSELDTVTIKNDTLRKYFPRSYTPKQMEDTIIKLLEQWQKKRQHSEER